MPPRRMKIFKPKSKWMQQQRQQLSSPSLIAEEYILHLPDRGIHLCKVCGHQISSPHRMNDLIRHIDAKHMKCVYPCRYCKKVCNSHYYLQRHVRKEHFNILLKERMEACVDPELDPNVKVDMWLNQNKKYLHDAPNDMV